MKFSMIILVLSLAAVLSCRAQDEMDMNMDMEMDDSTGDPILDAIEELAPSDFDAISSVISSQGQAPETFLDSQSPETAARVQAALSPYGIYANAPGPELESKIEALSPEDTLTLVENVGAILSALAPTSRAATGITTAGRKMK